MLLGSDIFLESDWAMCELLPEWAKAHLMTYPVPCCQAAQWLNFEAPALTQPNTIEVYLNGDEDPSLIWCRGAVVMGNFERLCSDYHAIAFEVDSVVRYVEIEGKQLLDTSEGILWPDCICSPAAQVQMLVQLSRK